MVLTANDRKRLDKLNIRRDNVQGMLNTLKSTIAKYQETGSGEPDVLQLLVSRTEKSADHLGEITCELIELEPNNGHLEIQEKMEGEFCLIVAAARRIIRQRTIVEPQPANNSTRSSSSPFDSTPSHTVYTKLPDQPLPQFDGRYEAWLDFKEDFGALVGNRTDITDHQKLRYLRTCLKGEPERMLRQHGINDANYQAAWRMLTESFEHKNKILERHFNGIFNIPPLQKESPRELSEMINTVQLHLSALKSLEQPIEQWSSILTHIVVSKLDRTTRKEWKRTQKGNVISKYNDLIQFLREAVLSADDWTTPNTSSRDDKSNGQQRSRNANQNSKGAKPPNQTRCFTTVATGDCPICKDSHTIMRCQRFKNLSARERNQTAIKAGLCLNCLRSEHNTSECTSKYTCRTCHKKHHTWLHYTEPAQPPAGTSSNSQA